MELGIDSFAMNLKVPGSKVETEPARFLGHLLEQIETADKAGVHFFGVGEHHREEFLDSAAAVILAAAAARTRRIRLGSAVTVLSAADPVRVFQEFATLDLISNGRAEIVAGKGSMVEAFPLFGFDLGDYHALFDEKVRLLLKLRQETHPHWSGRFRAPLTGQGVFPRPVQDPLPIWLGSGGSPESMVRAGELGLPVMLAVIGGDPLRFAPLVRLYHETAARAGRAANDLKFGLHVLGFVGRSDQEAIETYFPAWQHTFNTLGRERGWGRVDRRIFDQAAGPAGNLFVGGPETVARKALALDQAFGGLARITFQMTIATMPQDKLLRAIELVGTEVAPLVNAGLSEERKAR